MNHQSHISQRDICRLKLILAEISWWRDGVMYKTVPGLEEHDPVTWAEAALCSGIGTKKGIQRAIKEACSCLPTLGSLKDHCHHHWGQAAWSVKGLGLRSSLI